MNDQPITICKNCRHRGDGPTVVGSICLKNQTGTTPIDPVTGSGGQPLWARCADINDGNCPDFERTRRESILISTITTAVVVAIYALLAWSNANPEPRGMEADTQGHADMPMQQDDSSSTRNPIRDVLWTFRTRADQQEFIATIKRIRDSYDKLSSSQWFAWNHLLEAAEQAHHEHMEALRAD